MTREEARAFIKENKDVEESSVYILEGDEVTVDLKTIVYHGATFLWACKETLCFSDSIGRIIQTTEPYTITVTKRWYEDDK